MDRPLIKNKSALLLLHTLPGPVRRLLSPIRWLYMIWERSFPAMVRFTSFTIHAFGGTLCYDKPLLGFWEGIEYEQIYVYLKDGTVVEAHFRTGQNKGDHWEAVFEFAVPMAVGDVDYIEFPGSQKVCIAAKHS